MQVVHLADVFKFKTLPETTGRSAAEKAHAQYNHNASSQLPSPHCHDLSIHTTTKPIGLSINAVLGTKLPKLGFPRLGLMLALATLRRNGKEVSNMEEYVKLPSASHTGYLPGTFSNSVHPYVREFAVETQIHPPKIDRSTHRT